MISEHTVSKNLWNPRVPWFMPVGHISSKMALQARQQQRRYALVTMDSPERINPYTQVTNCILIPWEGISWICTASGGWPPQPQLQLGLRQSSPCVSEKPGRSFIGWKAGNGSSTQLSIQTNTDSFCYPHISSPFTIVWLQENEM